MVLRIAPLATVFGRASQFRIVLGTLAHHLYTSAGRYGRVHVGTPNGKSACLCEFVHAGGPLWTLSVLLVAGAGASGSSPLVGSPFCLQNPQKRKAPDVLARGFVSSTSAVANPKPIL